MRTKKAVINSSINILSFFISFIPNLLVRKIFLDQLGSELLGLSSLYSNIIGWLSIFEMGVGVAIIYSLYKPFYENDQKIVRSYIYSYRKFYRKVGFTILTIGLTISPIVPFFTQGEVNYKLSVLGFILFLINTFLTYLFSYKLCILNVAQETYKVTIGTTISKLIISILQIIMLKFLPNFILYIVIQILVNICYYIVINRYIDIRYSWINNGNEELDKNESYKLNKNVRAMFMHKIGGLVVLSTDNLVISKLIGLSSLTKYTNYNMIISALKTVVSTGLSGITASIGNLLTNNDKEHAYNIHKKIFFLNFWVISFIVITLYNTLNQFIVIWVGKENLLDNLTFIIILINLYFSAMRGSVEQFQEGSGTFEQDRYAPIAEAIINLITSLILVNYIGLAGVFLGTLISNFSVIFWTKPYVVYKYVFNKKLREYFKMYFRYLLISIIPFIITNLIVNNIKNRYDFFSFILNVILNFIIINSIYLAIFYKSKEFKYYKDLIFKLIGKNK